MTTPEAGKYLEGKRAVVSSMCHGCGHVRVFTAKLESASTVRVLDETTGDAPEIKKTSYAVEVEMRPFPEIVTELARELSRAHAFHVHGETNPFVYDINA